MSGHSKWATTKHRKAAVDAKRSALFSKLTRIITVAAKTGGDPNPENNASLAAAIDKAKTYSLPKDKIQTAIDKAFGAGADAANFDEVIYEGYGPAGVALYVEALTDNRNRTAADVRAAFTRAGGNLGATGSVAFQFERKGQILVEKSATADEDELMLLVADAGGEDLEDGGDEWVVYTAPGDLATRQHGARGRGRRGQGRRARDGADEPRCRHGRGREEGHAARRQARGVRRHPERLHHDGPHRGDRGRARGVVFSALLAAGGSSSGGVAVAASKAALRCLRRLIP